MCIGYGGVKMTLKGLGRMKKLVKYECDKCNKIWSLTPEFIIVVNGPIFCGFDSRGRKLWRQEGHCSCGAPFNYPKKTIDEVRGD